MHECAALGSREVTELDMVRETFSGNSYGKVCVLKPSKPTPGEGYRGKGLSLPSSGGLSFFCVCLASTGQQLAPKSNSQVILRVSEQSPGNGLPSTVRREWLSSHGKLGSTSQNIANQGAQTKQLAEVK